MNDMNKRKRIAIILTISAIVMTIIGGTFAYWSWQTDQTEQTAVTFTVAPTFSCSADGGGNITSNEKMLIPTSCTNANYAIKRTVKVNTTISDNNPVYLNMWLKINEIGTGLANSENFMYALTTSDQGCDQGTVIATGTFQGGAEDDTFNLLQDKEYLTTTTNDTYYLYIWLDTAESNSATQDQTFDMELGGECTNQTPKSIIYTIKENAVMDNIKSDFVSATTGINFNAISSDTNGKGIYIRSGTENDQYPIYYYRGAVTDNNVLFGGFCWKIVRTTSTGGTKLIYNGVPTGTNNNQCENTTGTATQLAATSKFNQKSASPAGVGYMYGARYSSASSRGTDWYYAPDVTYSDGKYTLVAKGSYNVEFKSTTISGANLNYHHYSCAKATECASVLYVFGTSGESAYYITLTNGKKVEDALDEMLTNSSNENNSDIKTVIDNWYETNMTSYTNKLEDTPYCNDRSIYQLGGWDPNGGSMTTSLDFGAYGRMQSPYTLSLTCNQNDAFTVSNDSQGNGKLTYPVGLLTADEIRLGGGRYGSSNTTYYLYTNQNWWCVSPYFFSSPTAYEFNPNDTGNLANSLGGGVGGARGVRPVVSLKAGTKFSGGDGTATNPYVVEVDPVQ